jgi:LysR family transcriptional regulator, low CO2-responsive transcriptional regulator
VESARIGINPMAFVAASHSPLAAKSDLSFAQLAQERFLVRELGSGTRNTVERLFKDAGQRLRVGSEMSSNEAIKQMCAAGFGPAFLSLHTCVLELQAGLLKLLALPKNPIERDWYVVRVGARPLPNVALAFEQFLRQDAQREAIGAQWQHALAPKAPSRPRPRAPRRPADGVAARAARS